MGNDLLTDGRAGFLPSLSCGDVYLLRAVDVGCSIYWTRRGKGKRTNASCNDPIPLEEEERDGGKPGDKGIFLSLLRMDGWFCRIWKEPG